MLWPGLADQNIKSSQQTDDNPEWEWESLTSYEEKLRAYLALFGALCQNSDNDKSGSSGTMRIYFSLDRLWIWSARLLNELPFNSYAATALAAIWRTAGYKLHQRFGRQFTKLMALVIQVCKHKKQGHAQVDYSVTLAEEDASRHPSHPFVDRCLRHRPTRHHMTFTA